MKHLQHFALGLILVLACHLRAQVSVTASAGTPSGVYTTLKAAFDNINNGTHQGVIDIDLSGNTVETASAVLNASGGTASYTAVNITASAPSLISGNITGAVIRLNGADFVTIDGRIGGTGRNIQVMNTSTASATAAIWLSSNGVGAGATNNLIRNCELSCNAPQNTGTNSTYGIIVSGTTISTTSAGADNDDNSFIDNYIYKVRYGICTRGESATNLNQNIVVSNNLIGPSSFGVNEIGKVGIFVQFDNNCIISGNEVRFVGGDMANTTSGADRIGIGLNNESWSASPTNQTGTAYTCVNNIVHDIVEERTFSSVGITLSNTNGGNPTLSTVANNMIYNIRGNGTAGDQTVGIGISGGNGDRVVFNTISLTGDMDPGSSASTSVSAAGIRVTSTTPTNLTIRNNVISVDVTSNTTTLNHYVIIAPSTTYSWGTGILDNNDYYFNPANTQMRLGGIGTAMTYVNVNNLAAWKTQFTPAQDNNSVSLQPGFVSASDLHMDITNPLSVALDNLGVPVSGINLDIDLQARNVTTPDIGADEFTVPQCTGAIGGTTLPAATSLCVSGSQNLSLSGNSSGAGITFQWLSSPNGTTWSVIPSATSNTYNTGVISSTTYYRCVVGCTPSATTDSSSVAVITVNPLPFANATPAGPITLCAPATAALSSTTNAGNPAYQWLLNGGNISGANASGYTATASGNYSVRITDLVTGCQNTSNVVSVTINLAPSTPVVSATGSFICLSDSTHLTASSAGNNYITILNEDFNSTAAGTTTSGNLPAGWNGNSLTAGIRIWGVVATAQGANTLGGGNFLYCESDLYTTAQTRSQVMTPVFNASQYSSLRVRFKHYYNDLTSGANTDSARVYISNNGGSSWTLLKAYDTDQGIWATPANELINVPGLVTLTNNMMVKFVYNSDAGGNDWYWAIDDVVIDGIPNVNMSWTSTPLLNSGLPSGAMMPAASNNSVYAKPATAGTYTYQVTVEDVVSGCTNTNTVSVTVNNLPIVGINLTGNDTICAGTNVTLNGTGAATYSWTGGVTDGNAFTPASTLTYVVTGTDANNCKAKDSIEIVVNALPVLAINVSANDTVCAGDQVTLNGSGAANLSWNNGVSNNVSFTPASTAYYVLSGTDANGCSSMDSVEIVVNSLPNVSITLTGNDTICAGDAITLTASGAAILNWNNGVNNGVSFAPLNSATYIVTGTDANGCSGMDSVRIEVGAIPSVGINLVGNDTICAGTSITLSGTGAGSYSWTSGVNDGQAFVPGSSAQYIVTGFGQYNCPASDSIWIEVNPLPVVSLDLSAIDTVCVTVSAWPLSGGLPAGGVYSGPNVSGANFDPTQAGTGIHTVTYSYTDNNGCSNVATGNIFVDACTGMAQTSNSDEIRFYPNPTAEMLYIENISGMKGTVELINSIGQRIQVFQISGGERMSINLSTEQTGIYFIKYTGQAQKLYSVIKQ